MDIQTVLTSLVASAFTVLGGKAWDTYWSKKGNDQELHYLAIRLAFLLDGYAASCIHRVADHENF